MNKNNTLEENIIWILEQYAKELNIEKQKDEPNFDVINDYENIIIELNFALEFSKKTQ